MEVNAGKIKELLRGLPGLDCGICGSKSCEDFAVILYGDPEKLKNCIHLTKESTGGKPEIHKHNDTCRECSRTDVTGETTWIDSLGRDYDFVLQTFPNEPGPRETMLPHNPQLIKELKIKKGDILIGRPLGMSCGCPITHCGVVMSVDSRNGVLVWCVTGPLQPRSKEYKDIGYYSAEAYEGIIEESRSELQIGRRYWFMPRLCMLQWRHSGLVNFLSKTKEGYQVRIEGLMIG